MTLGTIFRSVLGPSTSAPGQTDKFLAERHGGIGEYYHYGHHVKPKTKSKSKSDKKHAILSALSLLAFLFFLNILQGCIREQNLYRQTTIMLGSGVPTAQQSKEPDFVPEPKGSEKRGVNARGTEKEESRMLKNKTGNEYVSRKSRTLMGLSEEETTPKTHRQEKFIRHLSGVNNWTNELSQVSDKDLEDQKLKTLNFPLYWKNNRFSSGEIVYSTVLPTVKLNRVVESPVLSGKIVPPLLRRVKKRERITTSTEPTQILNRTTVLPPVPTAAKLTWNYNTPPPRRTTTQGIIYTPTFSHNYKSTWLYNKTQPQTSLSEHNSTWQNYNTTPFEKQTTEIKRETTTSLTQLVKNTPTTQTLPPATSFVLTTPRNRRSDYVTTERTTEYDDYDKYSDQNREEVQISPTPAIGLDLNTYQTFPVYNYYNHRYNINPYRENQTVELVTAEPSGKPEVVQIDRVHNEIRIPTEQPLLQQTKTPVPYYKYPYYEKIKYRNRYTNHHGHYHTKNHYPVETRYRYSPYRKVGTYEPHVHDHHHGDDHYYSPVLLAKYPKGDESGFDLAKFVWHMVSSFARPLTKLVPGLAKDNNDEPQCYDLLVCEVQRVSRFMGPTAEALASTVGTLLTWAVTEETRQTVLDAINSGKENTCQQQIRDCEDRSGGKSAMTVLAQVMEMKLR